MRHHFVLEAFGIRLRPVEMRDAPFIYELRNFSGLTDFIGPTLGGVAGQQAWLESYFERPDDLYFCVENSLGVPLGTVGLYALDKRRASAEWGRWVLKPGSHAAPASLFLIYTLAFDRLALDEVTCKVVEGNSSVIAIHERTGLARVGTSGDTVTIAGKAHAQILYRLDAVTWKNIRARTEALARIGERFLGRQPLAGEVTG